MFLKDNDSLKVYYFDAAMKQDVENTVKDWAKRKYFVPFNRSVVKDEFQDNRHIAPPNFEIKR